MARKTPASQAPANHLQPQQRFFPNHSCSPATSPKDQTSGNSPNVVCAMEYANSIGCKTIALTGRDGGKLGPMAQLNLHVAVPHMGRIEDAHMVMCHMIAYRFMEGG